MTKLSESIIGKIKCEHIAPVPRWHFLLKSWFFWVLFGLSVFLGSLSFSVIVHIASAGDLDVFKHLKGNLLTSVVMLLPYFWLFFLMIFAVTAYFNWKCTRRGYRYKRRWVFLISIGLAVFLGNIFYALGLAKQVDNLMSKAVPYYDKSKHEARKELWLQPENGLLTGKIINVDENEEKIIIKDETGENWIVDDKDIVWESNKLEQKGTVVKVIGKKEGEREFRAREIRRCNNCSDDEDNEEIDEEEEDDDGNKERRMEDKEQNEDSNERDEE